MELVPFKYPAFVVIAAILALYGDALALAHFSMLLAFVPLFCMVLLLSAGQVFGMIFQPPTIGTGRRLVRRSRFISRGWRSWGGIAICLALSAMPPVSFIYSTRRCQATDALCSYRERRVVVQGLVCGVQRRDQYSVRIDVQAQRLIFPVRRDCNCAVHLICFTASKFGDGSGRSSRKWLCDGIDANNLACVKLGSRLSADILVPAERFMNTKYKGGFTAVCHQIWCMADSPMPEMPQPNLSQCNAAVTAVADSQRTRLVEMHRTCIGPQLGDLLSSMVLGDKAVRLDSNTVTIFRDVGLSHVLAASGFNLTVVIAMTCFIGRLVLRSEPLVSALCMINMFCFVSLAGASASVMRAAIMCCVMLAVRTAGLRANLPAVMAIALLITLVQDPAAATDVGLQLSYAATVGIVIMSKPLCSLMCSAKTGFKLWFAETVAVVLSSQSAVLPIQLLYFGKIGLMFVPANLIVTPILAPVTILGFSSSTLWMLCPNATTIENPALLLCKLIDLTGVLPLQLMLTSVRFLASFEAAKVHVGAPSPQAIIIYAASWLLLCCSLKVTRHRLLFAIIYALALALLFWHPPSV